MPLAKELTALDALRIIAGWLRDEPLTSYLPGRRFNHRTIYYDSVDGFYIAEEAYISDGEMLASNNVASGRDLYLRDVASALLPQLRFATLAAIFNQSPEEKTDNGKGN